MMSWFCLAAWSHVPSGGSLSLVPCSFQGVSVQGDSVGETPLYGEQRVVRILPECILVLKYFNVMCEQHHRNVFQPILNGKKNGHFNATSEQTLKVSFKLKNCTE